MILDGFRVSLNSEFDIVATATTGQQAIEQCGRLCPDIVTLDLELPDMSGLEVIRELHEKAPWVKILVVTMHVARVWADTAFQAGAIGFVPKDAPIEELRLAIREVLASRRFLSKLVPERSAVQFPPDLRLGMSKLTPRQREVVRLLGEGKSTACIAQELDLCEPTITFHRVRIRKALGLRTEWDLTRYSILIRLCEEHDNGTQPSLLTR